MRPEEIHSYRFKSFTLKPLERQLFDGDDRISLAPKAFDLLTLLIDNAGHLVTKEQIMETIWADSFVEEANLARLVHTIRKTLSEDENGNKFIETVPTKGYRFVAEVDRIAVQLGENSENFPVVAPDELSPDRFELAMHGEGTHLPSPTGGNKSRSRWVFAGVCIVLAAGLVAAFAVWRNKTGGPTSKDRPISIAVLPFRPINAGERDLTYDLAFANSVIADLSQSKSLNIQPFSTMRTYTDVTQNPIAIGKENGNDYVLESNYLSNGAHLYVTSNLFNVQTGSVDAIFKYDGSDTDLFAAGPNVAAKIARDLIAKLNLAPVGPGNHGTGNEEAWRSYVQGMILSNKRTVEDAEKGVEEFNNAIRLDPNFAMAYMGLAHAIQTKITNGDDPNKLCGPARAAETKALELDPTSGDAMVMLATNRMLCTWEIEEAEKEYRQAIDSAPNSAHVRRFYAVNIVNEKRFDEALEHLRIARELEPNNSFNERLLGRAYFFARRWDDAIAQSIKVREVDPEAEQTSFVYMSYEMKGDLDNAFKWFLDVKQLEGEGEADLNAWRKTYEKSGWQGVLRRRLERDLAAIKSENDINKHARLLEEITTLSVQLGKYDQAFDYMSNAADSYVLFAGQMPVNPYLDPIRQDPRYKAIMARTWNRHGGDWN
jgi:DNA-binding winged helix-turn-helix (wHTH) protein/TolB-like protein/Tfp pilus assembly protein PilF